MLFFGVARLWRTQDVDKQRFKNVERHINNRPVPKFDYLTPIQQTLKHLAVELIT